MYTYNNTYNNKIIISCYVYGFYLLCIIIILFFLISSYVYINGIKFIQIIYIIYNVLIKMDELKRHPNPLLQ